MTGKGRIQALLAAALLFSPAVLRADSVVFSSQDGNNYTYNIYAPDGTLTYDAGDVLTITGLSGVTDVTLSDDAAYFGTVSWTDDTVTYTTTNSGSMTQDSAIDSKLFTITSSATSMGDLTYSMQESDGTYTGVVQTDVAATPEPSTLLLLGTGALGVGMLYRRRPVRADASAAAGAQVMLA